MTMVASLRPAAVPMVRISGTVPVGAFAGTTTFTWYSPAFPGVIPLNITSAFKLPIITTGVIVVVASGLASAGSPLAG